MPFGLGNDSFTGIDQDDGQVSRGGACYHVSGVLFMPGRIGYDKLTFGRGKIPVSHINRDALFAFGLQAIEQ